MNDGGSKIQKPIPSDAGNVKEPASRSRIGDILRSLMFRSDAKDEETKRDSGIESSGENEVHPADQFPREQSVRPVGGDCG